MLEDVGSEGGGVLREEGGERRGRTRGMGTSRGWVGWVGEGREPGPGGGWPCVSDAKECRLTPTWRGISRAAGCGTPEVGRARDGGRPAEEGRMMMVAFPKEGLQEARAGNAGVGVTPPKSG